MQSNTQTIGEDQITPQVMGQVAPDIVSDLGKKQLFQKLSSTIEEKKELDDILHSIAEKLGAKFSSRIKNAQTVVKKIAQKRLQGEKYNLNDVNDLYGARITLDKKDFPKVIKSVISDSKKNDIKVLSKKDASHDNYSAYHIDLKTPTGTRAEVQIHTPQSEAYNMAEHSLRSQFGQKSHPLVEAMRDKIAQKTNSMSDAKAEQVSKQVRAAANANGSGPLDPRVIASILQK